MNKLLDTELHILKLVYKNMDNNGETKVSKTLYKIVASLPTELTIIRSTETGGMVKLTTEGLALMNSMAWL